MNIVNTDITYQCHLSKVLITNHFPCTNSQIQHPQKETDIWRSLQFPKQKWTVLSLSLSYIIKEFTLVKELDFLKRFLKRKVTVVGLLPLRVIIKPERKLTLGSNSVLTSRCSCLITLLETVLIANGSHKIIAISLVNREKEKNYNNDTYNIHKIILTHALLPCSIGQSLNSIFWNKHRCFNTHKLPWIYLWTFWNIHNIFKQGVMKNTEHWSPIWWLITWIDH